MVILWLRPAAGGGIPPKMFWNAASRVAPEAEPYCPPWDGLPYCRPCWAWYCAMLAMAEIVVRVRVWVWVWVCSWRGGVHATSGPRLCSLSSPLRSFASKRHLFEHSSRRDASHQISAPGTSPVRYVRVGCRYRVGVGPVQSSRRPTSTTGQSRTAVVTNALMSAKSWPVVQRFHMQVAVAGVAKAR